MFDLNLAADDTLIVKGEAGYPLLASKLKRAGTVTWAAGTRGARVLSDQGCEDFTLSDRHAGRLQWDVRESVRRVAETSLWSP